MPEHSQAASPHIRLCGVSDFDDIYYIVNEAAQAYRGVIPADCWHEPYMDRDELKGEIESGVVFYGYERDGRLQGVMGMQQVGDATLIRHAYVRTGAQGKGIGTALLAEIVAVAKPLLLVGTWAMASWAIDFYRKHGFETVSSQQTTSLLRRYWQISDRQIETSVVLKWNGAHNILPAKGGNRRESDVPDLTGAAVLSATKAKQVTHEK
jgi:N-acetylglutamate synthase-like GNAT family acetyltransferase